MLSALLDPTVVGYLANAAWAGLACGLVFRRRRTGLLILLLLGLVFSCRMVIGQDSMFRLLLLMVLFGPTVLIGGGAGYLVGLACRALARLALGRRESSRSAASIPPGRRR